MAENRWQIGLGIGILALMLLAGAFSLGVYVGRHGLSREGLRLSGPALQGPAPGGAPRDGQPGPGQGLGGAQAFGLEQPDLVGRIRLLSGAGMELATPEGPRSVDLSPDLQIQDPQGASLELADLAPGQIVAIFGELRAGDGGRLIATRVVLLPSPPQDRP